VVELLANNPILIFFIVVAIGYPLGRLCTLGFRLGIASVLFSGLAVGALDQRFALPSTLYLFGLTLFIYTIGLASGPSFVALFKRQGMRDNLLVLSLLLFAGGMTAVLHALFLADVGTRSGYAFIQTFISREGLVLLLSGAAITLMTALPTLIIGHKVYHIPMSLLTGMQTQPAVLGFASEQTGNDLPTIGYATVFPLATIVKIDDC
jgi:uncharacterized transporter YbjL